jgi:hypothetical protein
MHFSRAAKGVLYSLFCISFISGSVGFTLRTWFVTEGDFGPQHNAWEPVLLKIHGASAFLVMIFFGWVLGRHVPVGWRSMRSRKSGFFLISCISMLILSGYALYYVGDEDLREITRWVHLSLGLSLPAFLIIHICQAVWRRRSLQPAK